MKYEIGDFVSKSVTGVCKIEDIVSLDRLAKREQIILSDEIYRR